MTVNDANNRLLFQLYNLYDNKEAANIADLVMEKITGWKRIDRVINKQVKLSAESVKLCERYTSELATGKPVQYVLNEAWFFGLKFYVDENVLIPRPETEELTDWILRSIAESTEPVRILDIGTGSGCIAIALKKLNPKNVVYACDINENALAVAKRNALENQATVTFLKCDIAAEDQWRLLPLVDIIVSNPPYIPLTDLTSMHRNVVEYEPHIALFVHDDDPLFFYKKIALFGKRNSIHARKIFVEVYENLAAETAKLFGAEGYQTEIKTDMQGKERMLKAERTLV